MVAGIQPVQGSIQRQDIVLAEQVELPDEGVRRQVQLVARPTTDAVIDEQ